MKVRAKLYEAEAIQFNGQSLSLIDTDGKAIKVYGSMRGHFVRRPDSQITQIAIGDWIVTEPEFRIMSNEAFEAQFEKIPEDEKNDGSD